MGSDSNKNSNKQWIKEEIAGTISALTGYVLIVIPVFLIAAMLLFFAIKTAADYVDGKGDFAEKQATETVADEQSDEEAVAEQNSASTKSDTGAGTEYPKEDKYSKRIKITDNFSYSIPKGAKKIDGRLGKGFSNEKAFSYRDKDGNSVIITSFAIKDEPQCFPDLAEYLVHQADEDAQIGYSTFEDTAMATSHSEETDVDDNKLYVTSYWWPDGGTTLCCVEIASYSKESTEVADNIRYSIGSKQYHGFPPGFDPSEYNQYQYPSDEDLKEAERQYYEQYVETDPKGNEPNNMFGY